MEDTKTFSELYKALQSKDSKKLVSLQNKVINNCSKASLKELHGTSYIQQKGPSLSILLSPDRVDKDLGKIFNFDSIRENEKWTRVCDGIQYKLSEINDEIYSKAKDLKAQKKRAQIVFCGDLNKYCERGKMNAELIAKMNGPVCCHYYSSLSKQYRFLGVFKLLKHHVVKIPFDDVLPGEIIHVDLDVFILG